PPQTLYDTADLFVSGICNEDGLIFFGGNNAPLSRVSSSGGQSVVITKLDSSREEIAHYWPHFLPDGRHFLFLALSGKRENSTVYIGSLDSQDKKPILKDVTEALYAPPGYILFMREGNLMAQSFNANRMELSGDAFPVAERIAANPTFGILALSASNTGVLAYRTGGSQAPYLQISWLNRNGTSAGAIGPPGDYASPELSSDGKRLAVRRTLGGNGDIWLLDLIRGVATRFTFDPGFDDFPIWSPNGSRIVFR